VYRRERERDEGEEGRERKKSDLVLLSLLLDLSSLLARLGLLRVEVLATLLEDRVEAVLGVREDVGGFGAEGNVCAFVGEEKGKRTGEGESVYSSEVLSRECLFKEGRKRKSRNERKRKDNAP
jgi:hypothetical protein